MDRVIKIDSVTKLNDLFGHQETNHPLVSVIDFDKVVDFQNVVGKKIYLELYSVMLKQHCHDGLHYGRSRFDFQNGTLIFIAPGQVIEVENEIETPSHRDWGLFFHPDLLFGSSLSQSIKDYSFFEYTNNEALHLSQKEKETLNHLIDKLNDEIGNTIDKHSQKLIVSNIELLLNYCTRYFDRQFITRANVNHHILSKLESTLRTYFNSGNALKNGLPSVQYLAKKLHLSPNYLSDLLKKETGLSALEHIHKALIIEAKRRLLIPENSISSVAYDLGFEYPAYFTRLFKKQTGMTPTEFIRLH